MLILSCSKKPQKLTIVTTRKTDVVIDSFVKDNFKVWGYEKTLKRHRHN